ncbi:MAG: Uma2 family endonuclease, partial [Anaerolineae bacterium]|nr:Uma2 family endonuclease [Anaerolineae bacterium]
MVTEKDILNTGMVGLVEVQNGEILSRSPNSYRQNLVANNLFALLEGYAALGLLARGQISFVLHHNADNIETLRLPDVSYLRTLPKPSRNSFIYGAPDLAVKVKADYETAADLETLVQDYLGAGAREVWLVYPREEELYV